MTRAARVGQADIERALKAVKRAGFAKARVVLSLNTGTIEIFLGEGAKLIQSREFNKWDDE